MFFSPHKRSSRDDTTRTHRVQIITGALFYTEGGLLFLAIRFGGGGGVSALLRLRSA
jgi:hypothetical protein